MAKTEELANRTELGTQLSDLIADIVDVSLSRHHVIDEDGADNGEHETPLQILEIRPGSRRDSFRIECEISLPVLEQAAQFGAALYPLFGVLEKRRNEAEELQRRRIRSEKRQLIMRHAGRLAFLSTRRVNDLASRRSILSVIAQANRLSKESVELSRKLFEKDFNRRLRIRRNARIQKRASEGVPVCEIAERFRLSPNYVRNIVSG